MKKGLNRALVIFAAGCLLTGCGAAEVRPGPHGRYEGMHFVSGGTFRMGEARIAEPVHTVTVSSFYIDTTLVTQKQYQALMHVNPSHFSGDSDLPVESVTWFDAALYCNARSKMHGLDTVFSFSSLSGAPGNGCTSLDNLVTRFSRNGYRLPTEAEYEHACRSGTTTDYYWGDTVDGRYCWFYGNSNFTMHPVAQKRANAFGLYDMAGSLWEWCNDWYGAYDKKNRTDPLGPATGTFRVARGGCWYIYYLPIMSSGFRSYSFPAPTRFKPPHDYYGFRCVLAAN